MPFIFNPFIGNFDYYTAGGNIPAPVIDGVLLAQNDDYIILESGNYLATE